MDNIDNIEAKDIVESLFTELVANTEYLHTLEGEEIPAISIENIKGLLEDFLEKVYLKSQDRDMERIYEEYLNKLYKSTK